MCANPGDDRAGANPFVGGLVRIIIVESAAGGVGAVEGLARGAAGGVGDGFVNLAVGDGGEGAGLVNDAGNAVREGGGLDAVEHHRTDRHLADIRFAAGLGRDDAGQQLKVGVGDRTGGSGRRGRQADQLERLGVGHAGGGKAVLLLELFDCLGGLGAVIAGDRSVKVAPGFQAGLDLGDLVALGAVLRDGVDAGLIRRLGGGEGGGRHLIESKADDAEIDEHQNCQLNQVGGFFSGNHSIAP